MKITPFARYRTAYIARALFATVVLLGSLSLGFAQELPPAQPSPPVTPAPEDPFAARQRAWDRARNPATPVAGPNIGRGPNVDFSPYPSCDSSCSVTTAQCFAACPGGRALDRINPAIAGRNPALARCQTECIHAHASCAIGCSKLRPDPPISRPPSPPGNNPARPIPPLEDMPTTSSTPLDTTSTESTQSTQSTASATPAEASTAAAPPPK